MNKSVDNTVKQTISDFRKTISDYKCLSKAKMSP